MLIVYVCKKYYLAIKRCFGQGYSKRSFGWSIENFFLTAGFGKRVSPKNSRRGFTEVTLICSTIPCKQYVTRYIISFLKTMRVIQSMKLPISRIPVAYDCHRHWFQPNDPSDFPGLSAWPTRRIPRFRWSLGDFEHSLDSPFGTLLDHLVGCNNISSLHPHHTRRICWNAAI